MNKEKTNRNKIVNVNWLANLHLNKIRKRGICAFRCLLAIFGGLRFRYNKMAPSAELTTSKRNFKEPPFISYCKRKSFKDLQVRTKQ